MPPERHHRDLAGHIVAALAEWSRARITLDELVEVVLIASPDLATSSHRSVALVELIAVLTADGSIVPSRSHVNRHGATLPISFRVARADDPNLANPAATHPWVPLLGWCGARRWSPDTFAHLVHINRWLAHPPDDRRVIPIRERSLEVLGDDKVLGRLLRGSLGRPEVVDALAVEVVHPPMAVAEVKGAVGRGVLVVENGTTFSSAHRAALHHVAAGRRVAWRWIGYGGGNQVGSIVPSLSELAPDHLAYFGDLDPEGLEMAGDGAGSASSVALPALVAHHVLYQALLDHGTPQHRPRRRPWTEGGLTWLGPSLGRRTIEVLSTDRWLAQEWVGLRWLTQDTTWLQPA